MMFSDEHRALWISCPKTGTHTMYSLLPSLGFERAGAFHERHIPNKRKDYLTFAIVRNPYARAVSAWLSNARVDRNYERRKIEGLCGRTLVDFVRWMATQNRKARPKLYGNQSLWYAEFRIDEWLHLKTLKRDFARLPFAPPRFDVPKLNESPQRRPWREYMTPEVIGLVNEWADPDFDNFGYERLAA